MSDAHTYLREKKAVISNAENLVAIELFCFCAFDSGRQKKMPVPPE